MKRRSFHKLSALVGALWVLAVPCAASAQVGARPDYDAFRPTADMNGFLTLPGAAMPGHLLGGAGLFFDYAFKGLSLVDDRGGEHRLDHRAAMRVGGVLGLGRFTALHIDLPFILANRGNMVGSADPALRVASAGVGDPRIAARARVAGKKPAHVGEVPMGAGLAFELGGTLPLGSSRALASDGQVTLDLRAHLDYYFAPGAGLTVSLGYLFRPHERVLVQEIFDDAFLFGVGMRVPVPMLPSLLVRIEIRGATRFSSTATTPVEGEIGLSYTTGPVSVLGYFGTGFTDGASAPLARAMLGLVFSRRTQDIDGDGIPDSVDKCPMLPEDFDGFEDEDGCEDPDNDGDFIMDDEDLCPDEAPPEGTDLDEDGCIDEEFR